MKHFKLAQLLFFIFCMNDIYGINIIHGPFLQNLSGNEATIVWVSDKPSVGWVELYSDDTEDFYAKERDRYYDTEYGIKNIDSVHSVKIFKLKPGTKYKYRLCVQEVLSHNGFLVKYGDYSSTNVFKKKPLEFITNALEKRKLSFAMINDIHENNILLGNLINQCDIKNTDLFIFNGDMVNSMRSQNQFFSGFLDKSVQMFASGIPFYYARGNHETRGSFANNYKRYINPKEEMPYYMFCNGPVCFVVLDSGEDKPDSDIDYYGITCFDYYRTRQVDWLKKILKSDQYNNAKFKVIICHIPPFGGWYGELEVKNKFMPLLNDANPDVMLCGHLHKYSRNKFDDIKFPIIVNSNNTILKANVNENIMEFVILNENNNVIDTFSIKK